MYYFTINVLDCMLVCFLIALIILSLATGPVQRLAERICLDYQEKFNIAIPSKILASSMGMSIHDA